MSTRRALAYSFVDRYAGLVIHTLSSIVVARLLTPGDIGVYSIAMVLIGFVATFRDLGAGQYFVRKQNLVPDDARAVWAVQLSLGVTLAAIVAIASLPVALFYREPRIQGIMLVIALNFAITPLLAYPNAWMLREMRFGWLAAIRFSGALATAFIAVGLAWMGSGPISLAWANLAGTLVGIAVTWLSGQVSLPWRPKISGIGDVISFGGRMTMVSLLMTVRNRSPEIFLGRLQGMTDTGLFSRGQGLVAMFDQLVLTAVGAVAFPFYAKQLRDGHPLKDSFLHACALVTVLGWSFLGCVAILAFPIIRVLYGNQWDDAVDPARWLAAGALFTVPVSVCFAPMMASGGISSILRMVAMGTCINVALAAAGAHFGLLRLTQLLIPGEIVWMLLWLFLARHYIHFEWMELLRTFRHSAVVAAAAIGIPLAVMLSLGWRSPSTITSLAIAVPGSALGFFVVACLSRHLIWAEILNALRAARGR